MNRLTHPEVGQICDQAHKVFVLEDKVSSISHEATLCWFVVRLLAEVLSRILFFPFGHKLLFVHHLRNREEHGLPGLPPNSLCFLVLSILENVTIDASGSFQSAAPCQVCPPPLGPGHDAVLSSTWISILCQHLHTSFLRVLVSCVQAAAKEGERGGEGKRKGKREGGREERRWLDGAKEHAVLRGEGEED